MEPIDKTAKPDIRIDKEGVWYFRGAEMFRKEIVNFFYEHIRRDEEGRYILELENDCCYLDVEDTPFVVRGVNKCLAGDNGEEILTVELSDDNVERLDPSRVWIGADNVPYCSVKNDRFYARFTRNGYYQLAKFIEFDDDRQGFFIRLNHHKHYLEQAPDERTENPC